MTLVLVDYSSVAHPLWHVHGGNPDPNATSTAIIAKVRELASGQPHVALCCDSGKSFRNELSADYKAQREKRPAALYHQLYLAIETLRDDGFPVWAAAGFEADDVIASAVKSAGDHDVLIVTADKDLAQLISERVSCFSPMTGKTRGLSEMEVDFGIAPSQVVDWLAIVGDKSDNVIGADGIGAVKATKLLQTFGNLDDLYAAIDRGDAALQPATKKALVEFRPRLADVRSLLTLRFDVPVPLDEIFRERVVADVATFGDEPDAPTGDDIAFAMPTLEAPDMTQGSFPHEIIDVQPEKENRDGLRGLGSDTHDGTDHVSDSPTSEGRREKPSDTLQPDLRSSASNHKTDARRTDAVVVRDIDPPPVEWERQLEPRTMNQAVQLATMMFKARLFSAYGTAEAVLSTVLAGRELGFQSMASLRAFHIIEGKPTLSAGAIHALVLRSGQADYFRCTERTPDRATFATKRKGDPSEIVLSFTLDEAKQAWSKETAKFATSGWGRNPADMCVARALTKLARLVYPDVVMGLYAPEEFDA